MARKTNRRGIAQLKEEMDEFTFEYENYHREIREWLETYRLKDEEQLLQLAERSIEYKKLKNLKKEKERFITEAGDHQPLDVLEKNGRNTDE